MAVAASCRVLFPGLALLLGRAGPWVFAVTLSWVRLRDLSARSHLAFMVPSPLISWSSFVFVFLNKQGAVFSKPIKFTSFSAASWSHELFSAGITQLSLHPTEVSVRPNLPWLFRASESDSTSPLPHGRSRPLHLDPFCRDRY